MVNHRSPLRFLPALIFLAGVAVQPAAAKPPDPSLYPLRVHIFESAWQANGYSSHGSGMANLIDGQTIHGFDFVYDCPTNYMKSVGNQAYLAKWKKPEKTIEIIGNEVGSQNSWNTCEFRITLHDFVYDIQDGTLSTFTQEQYKERIGAALPRTGPSDVDASHYPLRLSVLAIDWGPALNGSRSGTGRGNVQTPAGLSSVDFTTNCSATFSTTPAGRYYLGQWTQEGEAMALLLRNGGPSGGALTCTLKTSVHTDIYVLEASGTVKAVSQEEYRRTSSNTIAPTPPQPTVTAPAPLPMSDPHPSAVQLAAPSAGTPVTRPPVPGIAVPAFPGMPFTAQTDHLITRQVNGASVTTQMHGIIARDSQGRVHSENHPYTSDFEPPEKTLTRFTIQDPVAHTSTSCDVATHICTVTTFQPPSSVAVALSHPVSGGATPSTGNPAPVLIDNGRHLLTSESIGTRTIDNLPATGTRRTTSLAPGVAGNDLSGTSVIESWFSPDLQANLSETRTYPNAEVQEHSLKVLNRTEPDPSLFAIPAGFTIQDDRGKMPTIEVQKDLKMANNNMPNIGMPNSPLVGTSMGNGGGSGVVKRIGAGVSQPELTYKVDPEFSEEAHKAKFMGVVLVNLIVDANGMPQNVHVLRGVGMGLDEKAVQAVRQYRFKPAMEAGKPVAVELNVEVNFQIFDGPAPKQGALNSPPAGTSMGNGKGSGITPANPTASSANSATNAGQQNASITNQVIQAVGSVMGAAPEPGDLNTLRQQGMSAYQHGDYAGALGTFRHVIAADPSDIVAYNVAGNCSMHLKDYPSAIGSFKHALQLVPDEYHNLGALTRAYTLAGMAPERDELRKHILELAHAGKLPDTFNYVFDTFDAGGKRVEVAEFPKIQGYYGERYRFMVFSSAGIEVFCVTLESDALEQPAWARQHPKEAAAGGRQFSLDGYASDAHTSYGFFDAEPGYEQVRDAATQIIAGKKQPISRLSYPSAQPIPGDKNQ